MMAASRSSPNLRATGRETWPVLALVVLATLVPAALAMWFMHRAMENERYAGERRLEDLYRGQLERVRDEFRAEIDRRERTAMRAGWPDGDTSSESGGSDSSQAAASSGAAFARIVQSGAGSSVIVHDQAGGVAYPSERCTVPSAAPEALAFLRELEEAQPAGGADTLEGIEEFLANPQSLTAVDQDGRVPGIMLRLRALELTAKPLEPDAFLAALCEATRIVADYERFPMPASQRRFAMHFVADISAKANARGPGVPESCEDVGVLMKAEDLAAAALAGGPIKPSVGLFATTSMPGIWRRTLGDNSATLLLSSRDLNGILREAIDRAALPGNPEIRLVLPDPRDSGKLLLLDDAHSFATTSAISPLEDTARFASNVPFLSIVVQEEAPAIELGLFLPDHADAASRAQAQTALYLSVGIGVVVFSIIVTAGAVRILHRRLSLARLHSDLAATVSHELKTPVASTRLLVETLLEGGVDDRVQVREYLELIARENARLSRLIENFLVFSRIDRNRLVLRPEATNVAELLEGVAASFADRIASAGGELRVDVAADPLVATLDRDAISTVVGNLIDNSLKYTDEVPRIAVAATREGDALRIRVRDNGIGIPAREHTRIFGRFYQVDQRLSRRAEGTGLGLSIVRSLVEAHRGSIHVESAPGHGSTFTISIPIGGAPA